MRKTCILVLFVSAAMYGQQAEQRSKLNGTWQAEDNKEQESWVIEQKPDAVHVTHMKNGEKLHDFECNSMGRECKLKDGAHEIKVSMWFSGPKLVELETKGDEVIKRQFSVEGNGDILALEVVPIVPDGKAEVVRWKRAPNAARK